MKYTMTDFIDNRLDHYFSERELYTVSAFNIDDLRDCILMEIIKDAYYKAEKKQSLRANRGNDNDDLRMRDSRSMKYAQYYRTLQYDHVLKMTKKSILELLPDEVSTMDGKLEGHKITEMQYFEMNTISDFPLLKAIISKRICNVKSISNDTFLDYMNEYDELVNSLIKRLDGDDEDVIFGTIALFTLEWKYNIELFYSCAVEAEKQKVTEVPVHKLSILCAELSIPIPPDFDMIMHTECRFVLHRLDLVPYMYSESDEVWEEVQVKFLHYFVAKYYITREIVHKCSLSEYFVTHISRDKWADFFREHYNLRKMYKLKEWTNKRISYVRKLYNTMIKNIPTPKL